MLMKLSSNFVRPAVLGRVAMALSLAGLFGASAMKAQAVQADPTPAQTKLTFFSASPMALTDAVSSSSLSDSDSTNIMASNTIPSLGLNAMQYGGGRKYGRPRYRGGNTNADGSSKWTAYGGVGLVQPVGNTWHYYTPSYGIQVGAGRQFSKKFALPIEFDYDSMGLTGQTLNNQMNLYNNDINYFCNLNSTNAAYCNNNGVTDFTSLDGNAHIWSFTIDPTYTFYQRESVGAYAVAGVGYYHKVTNFTTPATGIGYDPYYGYYQYTANQVVDHYTSNAPGFSAGLGLTYKFSHFSNERFYGEVRYVFVDNSHRPGVTVNSDVASTYTLTNDFPANSNHTTYFPIKFGIRF